MVDPYHKRPAKYSEAPRRVRGGRKLSLKEWPERLGPIARGFLGAVEDRAEPEVWREGMEYAERGQTRSIEVGPGEATALVQGRQYRPYPVTIRVATFDGAMWERIVETLVGRALPAAKLLAGEMPENVEGEVLSPLGATLLPHGPEGYEGIARGVPVPTWNKHLCCCALIVADMLDKDPLLAWTLRGVVAEDLIERVRQRREITPSAGNGRGGRASVRALIPGSDRPVRPLEQCVDDFWDAGAELDLVETTVRPPEVSKALLRRLGPSPFEEGKFPLVGLLATCYEVISESALRAGEEPVDDDDRDPTGA